MTSRLLGPRCKRCNQGPATDDGFCRSCWTGLGVLGRAAFDAEVEREIAGVDWDGAWERFNERDVT